MVRIVTTEAVGDNARTVYYKEPDSQLCERMLFRADEAQLALATTGRPWAFDAPGADPVRDKPGSSGRGRIAPASKLPYIVVAA